MDAKIWLAYASATEQFHLSLAFEQGMTVQDALDRSDLLQQTTLPEPLQVGIFGVRVELDHILEAGDRVEIYRALTINPKDIRRKRAQKHPVGILTKSNRSKQS